MSKIDINFDRLVTTRNLGQSPTRVRPAP